MTDESDGVAPLQAAEAAPEDLLAVLRHWDEVIRSQQRTVLCGAEVEDAVRQAIERHAAAGLFNVQVSDVIPSGSVVVVDGHAIEANMRALLREGVGPRPASYWQADYRAIVDATWRGEFRDGQPQDATEVAPSEASQQ